tara:strand:+ start:2067 stop:2264 length:198 start_codon:yes stop_codon:yes gene_type:complete
MPSLDGYSLNEEIKKLRQEVFEELTKQREAFSELYKFLSKMEQEVSKPKKTKSNKKTIKKEVANA